MIPPKIKPILLLRLSVLAGLIAFSYLLQR